MADKRLLKSILDYYPWGRGNIGRPQKYWTEAGAGL